MSIVADQRLGGAGFDLIHVSVIKWTRHQRNFLSDYSSHKVTFLLAAGDKHPNKLEEDVGKERRM